jgi:hypothetical protein
MSDINEKNNENQEIRMTEAAAQAEAEATQPPQGDGEKFA